jgi:hypothetical protein
MAGRWIKIAPPFFSLMSGPLRVPGENGAGEAASRGGKLHLAGSFALSNLRSGGMDYAGRTFALHLAVSLF